MMVNRRPTRARGENRGANVFSKNSLDFTRITEKRVMTSARRGIPRYCGIVNAIIIVLLTQLTMRTETATEP